MSFSEICVERLWGMAAPWVMRLTGNDASSLIAEEVKKLTAEVAISSSKIELLAEGFKESNYRTALFIAGGVATGVATGVAVVYLIRRLRDQYINVDIIVANDSLEPICVTVQHEKGKNKTFIEAGESMKFTVFKNKPTTIRVKKSETMCTYDAEVCDYDYHNYIAKKATTGDLILVRAKKGKVWEAEPCKKYGISTETEGFCVSEFFAS